jgi:hypothetical protein
MTTVFGILHAERIRDLSPFLVGINLTTLDPIYQRLLEKVDYIIFLMSYRYFSTRLSSVKPVLLRNHGTIVI